MTSADEWLRIDSLDLEAQGVARNGEGKVVFVEDALPGEEVQVSVRRSKNAWEQAQVAALRRESAQRVVPRCPHFGVCGGCRMQHLDVAAQVAVKQRVLEDALWHLGKVRAERVLRPMQGPSWRYREKARLSVRHVAKKQAVLVGFHERKSSFVADIASCDILPRHVSDLLLPLRALIASMATRDRVPQIELAVGDAVTALVLRHLEPLPEGDLALLRAFAKRHGIAVVAAAERARHRAPARRRRRVARLRAARVRPDDAFRPTDFTQVNHAINEALVSRALRLLAPGPEDVVIDWFCGLGNFTLPLATRAARVVGVEGSAALVERATSAASANGLAGKTRFVARDLFELDAGWPRVVRQRRQVAARPAARRRVRDRQGAGRTARCGRSRPRLARAGAHRLRQLQPGDARARRRPARAPRRLPLRGRRRRQHVPAHGARRKHRGLRARGRLSGRSCRFAGRPTAFFKRAACCLRPDRGRS